MFKLTPELLSIHGGLMHSLLETFVDYISFTGGCRRTEFEGVRDFLGYRGIDMGMG